MSSNKPKDMEEAVYSIPPNFKSSLKWHGIKIVSILEGVALSAIFFAVILPTKLTWQVKAIILFFSTVACFAIAIHGIMKKSLVEFIVKGLKYIYTRKDYDYEDLREVYKDELNTDRSTGTEGDATNQLGRIIGTVKAKTGKKGKGNI